MPNSPENQESQTGPETISVAATRPISHTLPSTPTWKTNTKENSQSGPIPSISSPNPWSPTQTSTSQRTSSISIRHCPTNSTSWKALNPSASIPSFAKMISISSSRNCRTRTKRRSSSSKQGFRKWFISRKTRSNFINWERASTSTKYSATISYCSTPTAPQISCLNTLFSSRCFREPWIDLGGVSWRRRKKKKKKIFAPSLTSVWCPKYLIYFWQKYSPFWWRSFRRNRELNICFWATTKNIFITWCICWNSLRIGYTTSTSQPTRWRSISNYD